MISVSLAATGKFGSDLHINFYDNPELKQYCHTKFNAIFGMLHAMEGGDSKTSTNY